MIEYSENKVSFDSFLYSSLIDKKENGNLFLCSQNLFDKLLLSKETKIGSDDITTYFYCAFEEGNLVFFLDLIESNIQIEKFNIFSTSIPFQKESKIRSGRTGIGFSFLPSISADGLIHIGLDYYKLLLLLSGEMKAYYKKRNNPRDC